jgi:hypothetical protein
MRIDFISSWHSTPAYRKRKFLWALFAVLAAKPAHGDPGKNREDTREACERFGTGLET